MVTGNRFSSHEMTASGAVARTELGRAQLGCPSSVFGRGGFAPRWLHRQMETLACVIDRAQEPNPPARNRHGHLVEMPPRRRPWTSMAKLSGEQRPEFQNPSPHRFVGDIQTALREQI